MIAPGDFDESHNDIAKLLPAQIGLIALNETIALAASCLANRFSGFRRYPKSFEALFSTIFGFAAIRLAIGGNWFEVA